MSDADSIDPAALERLLDWGGPKLRDQMIRLFLDNAEVRIEQIGTGLAEGDPRTVERGGHALKSSAANVGAREVRDIAAHIEAAGTRGDFAEARRRHDSLEDAWTRAAASLRLVLQGGDAG